MSSALAPAQREEPKSWRGFACSSVLGSLGESFAVSVLRFEIADLDRRGFLQTLIVFPIWVLSGCTPEPHSWLPAVHAERLKRWGALDFVRRHLRGVHVGDTPWYGWVDVTSGIVRFQVLGDDEWHTAALIHEAAHVQLHRDGLRYYGAFGEAMADAITQSFWPEWEQRHPADIPESGPVGDNPAVQERGTVKV